MEIRVKSKINVFHNPKVTEQYYKVAEELSKLQKVIREAGSDCSVIRIERSCNKGYELNF
jgi:hypothetical protein